MRKDGQGHQRITSLGAEEPLLVQLLVEISPRPLTQRQRHKDMQANTMQEFQNRPQVRRGPPASGDK